MTDGMARGGWLLGVDLGTSHTVAMLRRPDGRTRPLLFDGQPLLPSAVYLDTTGRLHVGRDAVRLGQAEPGRLEPNPKRHVDAETVLLGDTEVPTADLLAALLGAVAREAVAATGFLPPAVLTYPAAWGARRREVLTTALARAGWPPATHLLPEPVAAARYFVDVLRRPVPVGSALAVFDFGGGTLDIAVVRNEGVTPEGLPRFAVAASGGIDDLGGLDLDAALVEHLGAELSGSEPGAWAALTEPVTLAQWRARRQFWEDVRGAKEMLSRTALAPVPVPGVEHAAHLTRDEFETAAGPLLRRGVAEAGVVIRAAGVGPTELAGLFLVGGSSRVPLVARLLHGELGIAPTVLEQPELPVAEGAIIVVAAADQAARTGAEAPAKPGHTAAADQADSVGAATTESVAASAGSVGAGAADSAATPAAPMRPAAVPPISDTMTHPAPAAEGDAPRLLSTEAMQPTSAAAAISTETDVAAASLPSAQGAASAQQSKPPAAAPP
ncbi:Hsp70 family protein, partial [Actinoplanes sp. NPDC048791]|uniref:Hsp70 family protein n=1 Tax=Actinoplanes sp. NPDC048791 TaxID=3154623 RepID=UPI0033E0996B